MCTKEEMNERVYEPIRQLKQRFYDSKDEQQWNACKEELVELLATAQDAMTPEFYVTYKEGVLNSIKKMWDFKQTWFSKQKNGTGGEKKVYPVKSSYIFREEEGKAFIELCNAMSNYLNLKCNG